MARRERMLDLRSGGWLVLLAVALVAATVWWMVLPVLRTTSRAVGDGRNVETYDFDLSAFTLSRDVLVAAGFPKNGVPTLDDPAMMRGSDVVAFNEEHRGKYLVSEDRVVGVALGGGSCVAVGGGGVESVVKVGCGPAQPLSAARVSSALRARRCLKCCAGMTQNRQNVL